MQAIVTKYLGPTNTLGARIKVQAYGGSRTYSWDYAQEADENHDNAALWFAEEMQWLHKHRLVGGSLPNNTGNCYVMVAR